MVKTKFLFNLGHLIKVKWSSVNKASR